MQVVVTDDAYRDLVDIHDYIAATGSGVQAGKVMDRLFEAAASLVENPQRGSHPRELIALGVRGYRQVILKPWRIIYRVETRHVVVYLVADGRRDMRSLLAQRLLNA